MNKRIGANQRKAADEQRARRPRLVRKAVKSACITALVCAALFAGYIYSPAVVTKVSCALKLSKSVHANFRIVNCGPRTGARLRSALDSVDRIDSLYVDRAGIIAAAAGIPEIEKVKITKAEGKTVQIKVTERKPVAIVNGGDISLVDKNGIRFSAEPGQYYDLPLVNFGNTSGDTVRLEMFEAIKKASRDVGATFFGQISQMDLSDETAVNLIFKSGKTEYILAPDNIEARLAQVKKVAERLREGNEEPARVDLRYRNMAYSSI